MRNFTIYLVLLLCLYANKMLGQDTFENRAKNIATTIENITKEEKEALKIEVEAVNDQLIDGVISKEEADNKKKVLAEARAINIEKKVASQQEALKILVQEKVDGKISETDTLKKPYKLILKLEKGDKGYENKNRNEKRTTTQVVFAAGLNNLVTDKSVRKSDFRYIGSHFYEWGLTYNTRILKNDNLLHAKYGFSVMYNNLRPTENKRYVVNGNQTYLEINPTYQEDSRFRTVSLVIPLHLELDFSENKTSESKTYFKSHDNFRVGFGGYFGTNVKSKQIIKYEDGDYKSKERVKGDFNVNNFVYGLSTYVGYKATSLYLKYDLNPLFTDNVLKQNNVSLGIRFDFN